MRIPILLLLAALAAASEPRPAAASTGIAEGLMAAARDQREAAEAQVRKLARSDPGGLVPLWKGLDRRGRCGLVRALGSAGNRHAALVGFELAGGATSEVYRAFLRALPDGGERALFAEAPASLSPARRSVLSDLRLRWQVERELVRLKSPAGQTGHYTGQFDHLKKLGPRAIPVLFDIVRDFAHPLPGEGAAGRYESLHPEMVRFGRRELRNMVAIGIAEVIPPGDRTWKRKLYELWETYWGLDEERYDYLREDLAPSLAYALHDLGIPEPGLELIDDLYRRLRRGSDFDRFTAMWDLGYANIRLGNFEEGEAWYERIVQSMAISRHVAAYNLACNFAMRAMQEPRRREEFRDRALDWLERAVNEFQWHDWPWMEADGDLNFIRKHPRYQALLRKLKARFPDRKKGTISKRLEDFLKNAQR